VKRSILILIVIICAGLVGTGSYFLLSTQSNQNKIVSALTDSTFGWKFPVTKFPSTGLGGQVAYSSIRDPGGVPQGLPVQLQIPVIGVDSAIEDALITPDGRMDVPAGSVDVAWFALGPHPGQVGSAVIGGHYGIENGVPFVFYNLDKLKVGDKIYIVDDGGNTITFVVRSTRSFDRNADATTVFTSSDGIAHLNLITCEGIWNQVNGNYPQRLVIFTDEIPNEAVVPASVTSISNPTGSPSGAIAAFSKSLGIGDSGADVVALQTFLEQRGLLELPAGVTNGFFGALTSAAVAKYQSSEGLPSVGVFGPLTMARLNSDLNSQAALPNTGINLGIISSNSFLQVIIQSVKSLYGNLLEGIITSLLIISIIFMAFEVMGRNKKKS